MPNPRGSAGSSPETEVRKTFVGQQARHVLFQVGLRTRRVERLWRPNVRSRCSSATAARKPASFGRFRQGSAGTCVDWAFAGRHRWNPRQSGVCGQALWRCPFHAGFGACSVAAGLCLHCALSAAASVRGRLNVCGVRTSAVAVRPQRLPGSPRLLGISERAALEPAWIGRLRAGSADALIPRGFQA